MKTFDEIVKWIIQQHADTNHMYDKYLPYEFHLRMAAQVAQEFKHLIIEDDEVYDPEFEKVLIAIYGHDLIEDTRVSYSDVKKVTGELSADIIYALTNEKGKNRKERANEKYYTGIRETPYAIFAKLCDRIANVRYGIITGSKMPKMYAKENENFGRQLGLLDDKGLPKSKHRYQPMFQYLDDLFKQ